VVAVVLARALYSASVLDLDIVGCFLTLHHTRFVSRKIAKPPVDLQSENPFTSIDEDFVICNPKLMVPLTKRKIIFTVVRCTVVGACIY
jgi:hypothetical protein